MKFLRVDLQAYGHFTNVSVAFPADGPNMHLIYGPNEAGKSTTLRALTSFLYGIEVRTTDAFLHDMSSLRIGARLQRNGTEELELVRRKGNRDTLRDNLDQPVDEALLRSWLGGVSREHFTAMFGLDHEMLRQAGEDLAKGKGDAGQSLFGAAVRGVSLQKTLVQLQSEMDEIYLPRGRVAVVNAAADAFKSAQNESRNKLLPPAEWKKVRSEFEQCEVARSALRETTEAARAEHRRAERLKKALPWLARRSHAQTELGRLGQVRMLPAHVAELRRTAQLQFDEAQLQLARLKEKQAELTAEASEQSIPPEWSSHAKLLRLLPGKRGSHQKAVVDLPSLKRALIEHEKAMRSILSELGCDGTPLEEIATLRLDKPTIEHVLKLKDEGQLLEQEVLSAEERMHSEEAAVRSLRTRIERKGPPRDVRLLQSELQRLHAERSLEKELVELRRSRAEKEAVVTQHLQRLHPWTRSIEDLTNLSAPPTETIQEYVERFALQASELKGLQQQQGELEREAARLNTELTVLNQGRPVPSEVDLQLARERRNNGWLLVSSSWRSGLPADVHMSEYASGQPLIDAFENAMQSADSVADRLRQDSERSNRQQTLRDQLAEVSAKLQRVTHEAANVCEQQRSTTLSWQQLWSHTKLAPSSPREMLVWRQRLADALNAIQNLEEVVRLGERLEARMQLVRSQLEAVLQSSGLAASSAESWSVLLSRADLAIRDAESHQHELNVLNEALEKAEYDHHRHDQRLHASLERFERWRVEWATAMGRLALPPDARREQASKVIELRERLFAEEGKRQDFLTRVRSIGKDTRLFEEDVRTLAAQLAPELKGEADDVAEALYERFRNYEHAGERRAAIERQLAERRVDIEEVELRRQRAHLKLNELLQEAACSTVEDLVVAEERSNIARQLQAELAEAEARLLDLGEGWSLEQLVREASALNADQLSSTTSELEEKLTALDQERSTLEQRIGSLRQQLAEMSGSDEASRHAQEAQAQLARMRDGVDRYVRLRLAAAVLNRAIESYRRKNEGPIIERASVLFKRLTLGRYDKLRIAFHEDKPKLRCVRDGADVDIASALSDGTRDQLFLALRLASLEQHVSYHEPLPLILDDIFIHFDDRRTQAGLEVLAEVSERTQVLLFTHHARLLELARETLRENQLSSHSVPSQPVVNAGVIAA